MLATTSQSSYFSRTLLVLLLFVSTAPLAAAPTTGLVLHLDAATLQQPDGPLAAWPDASGQGHEVRQAEAAAQPRFEPRFAEGRPAVVFSGEQWLDGPAALPAGSKSLTYVAVWQRRATGGSQVILEQAAPGDGRRAALLSAPNRYGFNGESNDQHALWPFEPGEFAVSVLRLEPDGTVTLFHDGYAKSGRIDAARQNTGADKLRIGAKIVNGQERLDGAVREILVYDRAVSDTEARQITSELVQKWGIRVTTTDPDVAVYSDIIQQNAAKADRYDEPYRPQYHFTPIEGWMNDPNGLVFFRGQWQLFYQHNGWGPGGAGGPMQWGHAVSSDLIHWQHRLPAIMPDELGAIWSGSAVVDAHDTSGFFGGKPGLVCIFTYQNPAEDGRQSQGIAYSADGVTFTKYAKNPVIPQLRYQPGQPDDHDFRDPKVFWHEPTKRWIMVVAGGTLRFYSSPNLREWTFESINNDIHTECPDFFQMPVEGGMPGATKWVLSGGGNWYRTGSFDGHKFTPETAEVRFNYGHDFYASQTWNDAPDGRRIMISWLYNWGYNNWPTKPFSGGCMTLPYELKLHQTADGPRIYSTPVHEVDSLRGAPQSWAAQEVSPGTNLLSGVRGKAIEIEAEFEVTGAATSFGFKVPGGTGEATTIGYRVGDHSLFVDRRNAGFAQIAGFDNIYNAPLPAHNNRVKLHLYLDRLSAELFGNDGEAVITSTILPDPQRDDLELFAEVGAAKLVSLKVWPMRSVWK